LPGAGATLPDRGRASSGLLSWNVQYTVYSMQIEENRLGRANLNDAAEIALRAMIVDGRLAAGERLNEVHLSERLGVSRTPLREALNRLTAEGAVEARPRFGYFVKPLTLEEFEQIYDIRPILDPAALHRAGIPAPEQIARLQQLNLKLIKARDATSAMAIDDAWHLALLEHCPNRALIDLIATFMRRTRRYELALMRSAKGAADARGDHARILDALKASDLDGACAALRENLQNGKAPIVAWLKSRAEGHVE